MRLTQPNIKGGSFKIRGHLKSCDGTVEPQDENDNDKKAKASVHVALGHSMV